MYHKLGNKNGVIRQSKMCLNDQVVSTPVCIWESWGSILSQKLTTLHFCGSLQCLQENVRIVISSHILSSPLFILSFDSIDFSEYTI